MISNLKNHNNIRLIFADSIRKLKAFEYDDFYQNCVQATKAIWAGSVLMINSQ